MALSEDTFSGRTDVRSGTDSDTSDVFPAIQTEMNIFNAFQDKKFQMKEYDQLINQLINSVVFKPLVMIPDDKLTRKITD